MFLLKIFYDPIMEDHAKDCLVFYRQKKLSIDKNFKVMIYMVSKNVPVWHGDTSGYRTLFNITWSVLESREV